jgi:hypothetical protein
MVLAGTPYLLTSNTIHDDAATDVLYGGDGRDWFFYLASGAFKDYLIVQ